MTDRVSTTLSGIVEKTIPSCNPTAAEEAQIAIQGVDGLQQIRIDNVLTTKSASPVSLKKGATVKLTIKA